MVSQTKENPMEDLDPMNKSNAELAELTRSTEDKEVLRAVAEQVGVTFSGNTGTPKLKEKILAARRAGIETIVCPKLNQKELDEVPTQLRRGMTFHLVEDVDEVLKLALVPPPRTKGKSKASPSGKASPRAYRPRPRRQVNV
jgi:ATP-dependent Lon protease